MRDYKASFKSTWYSCWFKVKNFLKKSQHRDILCLPLSSALKYRVKIEVLFPCTKAQHLTKILCNVALNIFTVYLGGRGSTVFTLYCS